MDAGEGTAPRAAHYGAARPGVGEEADNVTGDGGEHASPKTASHSEELSAVGLERALLGNLVGNLLCALGGILGPAVVSLPLVGPLLAQVIPALGLGPVPG